MAAGRPPTFENEEQIAKQIDRYFTYIKGEFHKEKVITIVKGKPVEEEQVIWDRYPEHPTITGLTLYIGFASRQSFYDYEKEGEFSYTLKRARLTIEKSYEMALHGTTPAGAIFALKNFGWADVVQNKNENYNINVEPTPEEAQRIKESLDKLI